MELTWGDAVEGPSTTTSVANQVLDAIRKLGFLYDIGEASSIIRPCKIELEVELPVGEKALTIADHPAQSWYTAISFIFNGQLYAEYCRVPTCSNRQWDRIIEWTEKHVTELARWSCEQVRQMVKSRDDHLHWTATYDGFYLTRGHYSNNSSATLHDFATGNIAWFTHRTKRGLGHNWEGTSAGAESDMFHEILREVKDTGFVISEIVTDKDSILHECHLLQPLPRGYYNIL